jgi:thiamine-phosphate pyrophosphorylase
VPAVPRLILVTDRHATGGRDFFDVVAAALDAGLPAVQLRDKDLPARALFALAERLRVATARTGAKLFVNGRVDVAIAVGADGVHLGGGALPVAVARSLLPPGALIGVSTHVPRESEAEGADYVFFGPVWDTPGKRAQGKTALAAAVAASASPLIAIGGIGAAEARVARRVGAAGVAVIRALLAAPDPTAETRALLAAIGD